MATKPSPRVNPGLEEPSHHIKRSINRERERGGEEGTE